MAQFRTEAEAKLFVCPFRRDGGQEKNCIASRCMMWRWNMWQTKEHINGYCGMAGVPEPEPE